MILKWAQLCFGAVAAGFGSKIVKGMKVLERVGVKATDAARLIDWSVFSRNEQRTQKQSKVPFDLLFEMTDAALYARFQAENGGTLYRLGTTGNSEVKGAQYWALEHRIHRAMRKDTR